MDNERERSAGSAPPNGGGTGPMRGGKPIEPTPQDAGRHPSPEAEERCEDVREGGNPQGQN